jgi:putative glycerol-1-phosphate prenyltransferase
MQILTQLEKARAKGEKKLGVLIDPDKIKSQEELKIFIGSCEYAQVDYLLVGGSLLLSDSLEECVSAIKSVSSIPVILFPGSPLQISARADAILFLSLISGRNPELLIGNHVISAPYLKKSGIEVLPVGYLLIDCGNATTVSYISNTQPIPYNKPEIAACTALAGEMLGLRLIYLDGGSGAQKPISQACVQQVRAITNVPVITGGGIRNLDDARAAWDAGADMVVIGTAFEKDEGLLASFRNRLASIN